MSIRNRLLPVFATLAIAAMSAGTFSSTAQAKAAQRGKWHFKKQGEGAMLGWSSGLSSEELDGLVLDCSKKGGPINASIDLNQSFQAGARAEATIMAGTKTFELSGSAQDGLNGPMMTVDLKPEVAKALLTQQAAIGLRLHSKQTPQLSTFPPSPAMFRKFLARCVFDTK